MKLRPSILIAIAFTAASLMARAEAPTDGDPIPIPEQRTTYGWLENQRIQFKNIPLMRQAQRELKDGEDREARAALEEALRNDPGNNHAKVLLISVYDRAGEPEKAIALCDDLAAAYPDYLDPLLQKGYITFRLREYDRALSAFESIASRMPENYARRGDVIQNLAQLYYLTGRYDQAEKFGEQWLKAGGEDSARKLLAESAIKRADWDAALLQNEALLEHAASDQARGELELQRGFILSNAGRFDEANAALDAARKNLPGEAAQREVERQMGFNALKMNRPGDAAEHFKKCLLGQFDEALSIAYLEALSASAQFDLCRAEAKSLLKNPALTPSGREAAESIVLYSYQRQGDDAGLLKAALRLHKDFPKPAYLKEAAAAAQRLGLNDQAVELYRKYLEASFDPTTALNLYYLLKKRGDTEGGIALLNRALDANPSEELRDSATYELAQMYRAKGDEEQYLKLLSQVVARRPESQFLQEYAVQLYGSGHYEEAADLFSKQLATETNATGRFQTCKTLAEIQLALQHPAQAKSWLAEAAKYGAPDLDWQLGMARADYQMENFAAVVERLLPLSGRRDAFYLYMGFAFYRMGMPGLALMNLNRVADSDKLSPRERYNLFSNRAYLQFDQDQNEAALADADRALAYEYTPDLALVRVKALIRLNRFDEAISAGRELLDANSLPPVTSEMLAMLDAEPNPQMRDEILALIQQPDQRVMADACRHIGLASFRKGDPSEAITYFTKTLELDPTMTDVLYLRGLSFFKSGQYTNAEQDFLSFYSAADKAGSVPDNFWGDLGVLEGDLGDYDLGTTALAAAAHLHPADVDSREESAYQNMKWNKNKAAQSNFMDAIALYNQVTPHLQGADADEYDENRRALKRENGFLDKTWGAQAYFNKTDYRDEINTPVQSIDGALPSQAGALLSYRPPDIGFRDQKTLDIYGRLLGNFESADSWRLNPDSYQGGVGIVYKPLAAYNLNISFERLFKIGDNAENNWLWRNLYSWERGEKPRKNEAYWWYSKLYGEVSYFLEQERRWIYYLDGRLGLTLQLRPNLLLTLPQGMALGRYQSNDPTGLGTYTMVGIGGTLRLLEREKEFTIERWYLDAYGYYVWGWFDDRPEGLEDRAFEGVIFGVNFVK